MDAQRTPSVSIIGASSASPEVLEAAESLGRGLVDRGCRIVTGGLGGVMAAASRGGQSSRQHHPGSIVGILPGDETADANPWVDVCIPTALGIARNVIVVRSGDVVVAVGGGSGTLSEMALAWQLGKPLVALDLGEGWSSRLAGEALDERPRERIHRASSVAEALDKVETLLSDLP